ncbi:hypothetical protein [Saccharibacillus alkalitolerans]|uniref:Peptidase C-terminal archaeal/bacterial domain-containing protein n=1 Tax=Saccharibacillus alkalitolerans TaxID=2705290 RepID=A0ABX0FDA7_9BACL|nr:hypothetical protein [Saccharibacillus alkalitolerans]NGZ77673.1 hypothetical protein [Saccharibacillus alkalitolerans]
MSVSAEGEGSSENIPAKLATYNWNGVMTYGGPYEAARKTKAMKAEPKSVIRLAFDKAPEEVNVRRHTSSSEFVEVESEAEAEDHSFTLPERPGEYVYGIEGDWPEGAAIYGIKIKVE